MKHLKALIAGGGIGGLTTALCLASRGHEVAVFERAAELGETGAGIQLSPNCTRVLHELGLEQALRESAFLPEGAQFRHWRTGMVISESVLGDQGINIIAVAQGASECSVSMVVSADDAAEAVRQIHARVIEKNSVG